MQGFKLFLPSLLLLISIATSYAAYPATGSDIIFPALTLPPDLEPEQPKEPIKHRIPSKSVMVTVSCQTGVTIEGATSPVLLYEVADIDDTPVFITADESEFIDLIMNLTGEFEVKFHTGSYLYVGYVSL